MLCVCVFACVHACVLICVQVLNVVLTPSLRVKRQTTFIQLLLANGDSTMTGARLDSQEHAVQVSGQLTACIHEPHKAKTILQRKNVFFEKSSIKVFFTAKCCYQLKRAGNALSKENAVVSVTGNDRNTVWHSTTYSGARRAIQNANQVHKISSGPLRTT